MKRNQPGLFDQREAIFSPCRRYRYLLRITWGKGGKYLLFIMLNPSTADEVANDPTVERCERRARQYGYDGLIVCNLFAWRDTAPEAMKTAAYTGAEVEGDPDNLKVILASHKAAAMTILAWGGHGRFRNRARDILTRLSGPFYALKYTDSEPWHPLYVGYEELPKRIEWTGGRYQIVEDLGKYGYNCGFDGDIS